MEDFVLTDLDTGEETRIPHDSAEGKEIQRAINCSLALMEFVDEMREQEEQPLFR